jgi:hypothetical protein
MKKVFYLFTTTIFLVACVFSSSEKDKPEGSLNVTSPAPETDAAPSTDNHIYVDTSAVPNEGPANSETPPATTANPGSNNGKGSQPGREMNVPPPSLDTVAVH